MPSSSDKNICTAEGCDKIFARPKERVRHEDEYHNPKKQCSYPGCKWKGAKRASRVKAHEKNKHGRGEKIPMEVRDSPESSKQTSSPLSFEHNAQYYQTPPVQYQVVQHADDSKVAHQPHHFAFNNSPDATNSGPVSQFNAYPSPETSPPTNVVDMPGDDRYDTDIGYAQASEEGASDYDLFRYPTSQNAYYGQDNYYPSG